MAVVTTRLGPAERGRVDRALLMDSVSGARHRAFHAQNWSELRWRLRTTAGTAVAVVDPTAGRGDELDRVLDLLARHPAVPVVVYSAFSPTRQEQLLQLGRAGIAALITPGANDDPKGIAVALAAATHSAGSGMSELLAAHIVPELLPLIAPLVARRGKSGLADTARALRLRPDQTRTLERRLRGMGFPPPAALTTWAKVLAAASLLDDHARTVQNVARATGFRAEPGMQRAFRRLLGMTAGEARARGAARVALRAFLQILPETALLRGSLGDADGDLAVVSGQFHPPR